MAGVSSKGPARKETNSRGRREGIKLQIHIARISQNRVTQAKTAAYTTLTPFRNHPTLKVSGFVMSQENSVMSSTFFKPGGRVYLFGGLVLLAVWLSGLDAIVLALADNDEASEVEVVIKRKALNSPTRGRITRRCTSTPSRPSILRRRSMDMSARWPPRRAREIKAQSEAVRLDDTRAALVLKRSRANHQAGRSKKLAQAKNDADLVASGQGAPRCRSGRSRPGAGRIGDAGGAGSVQRGVSEGVRGGGAIRQGRGEAGDLDRPLASRSRFRSNAAPAAPGSNIDIKVEDAP